MASVDHSGIDEVVRDIASSIPGPQDGESAAAYRARVNQRLLDVVDAVSHHKQRVEAFIRDHSDAAREPADQFFNAVRRRFITDEFEG